MSKKTPAAFSNHRGASIIEASGCPASVAAQPWGWKEHSLGTIQLQIRTPHMRVHQTFGETRLPLHQQPENVYNQKTKYTFSH